MLAFVRTLGRVAGTVVNLRSPLGYFCHLSAPAGSAFFWGKGWRWGSQSLGAGRTLHSQVIIILGAEGWRYTREQGWVGRREGVCSGNFRVELSVS
jgi:hypothetical protein